MMIDFKRIADVALSRWNVLLPEWLWGGKLDGHEFKALNPTRADSKVGSFSVNVVTGKWADFATGDQGGDLVSLYAYINSMSQKDAAMMLAGILGVDIDQENAGHAPAKLVEGRDGGVADRKRSPWVAVIPAPDDAPDRPVAHYARGRPDVVYTYRTSDGGVAGYVYRFTTSDGGKELMPVCFCKNSVTGEHGWRWQAFPEPRMLYGLDLLALHADRDVLLVEGEKCADAARAVIGDRFVIVTWPGGGKAVGKIDWRPLGGRKVFAWADCDAQREKLTKAERDAGVDPTTKPLLPEKNQPGMKAMLDIRRMVLDIDASTRFEIVDIPEAGKMVPGWDIADAIDDGMGADALVAMINTIRKQSPIISTGHAGLHMSNGKIVPCLSNIYDVLLDDPKWRGVLAFNEFSYVICKQNPPPFDSEPGEWDANDDVQAAMWLTRNYGFAPDPTRVAEAVEALAKINKFHPVRNYLKSQEWDGVKRCDDWITDYIGTPKSAYVMRVSRWFLMGMIARVMEPGVKFDYCLVLEGSQGRRKSSLLRTLAGEWFADTDLDLHNKDSMSSIRGKWLYEFAELDSLARAEAARQKSFLSRQVDEYRPPYGRRDIRSPRQLVFGGSTNEWSWNKDGTGGRRFWPIVCAQDIDCEGLAAVRDQLFAEAYHRYKAGERFWPTNEEQRLIFDPEQVKRHEHDSFIDMLEKFVSDQIGLFPMADAAYHLKIDPARLSRDLQTRIGRALQMLGCTKEEKRTNTISRFWYQPPARGAATPVSAESVGDGSGDGIPF
ncbi:MAG: hypothetical protein KF908_05310 [Nitrosomonas sp.]|nr:hypothetical protein [Nitrosomonas sp.]